MTNPYKAYMDELRKDPVKLKAWYKEIMGPSRRVLPEPERKEIWLLLQFVDPVSESNNQRTSTEVYHVGGIEYHVTYGIYDYPLIEEIENDDK